MSTGLTYVTITDIPYANPELSSAIQVFNSYDEAYAYAEYLGRFDQYKLYQFVVIWTSGPNQNGTFGGNPWTFTPID